jgi:hypothetical protein
VRIGPGPRDLAAAEVERIRRGLVDDLPVEIAVRERVEPLVLDRAEEELPHARATAFPHELRELLLHRIRDEPRARLEIAHPPAQRQRVDERNERQREQRQRDRERGNESQGESYPAEGLSDVDHARRWPALAVASAGGRRPG